MSRDFTSERERITWAIERSGLTLVELAQRIGCTHATLSQWTNGHTTIANTKVGLISRFAQATGVHLEWLLTGDGPAVSNYSVPEHPLVETAKLIAQEGDAKADLAMRLLKAMQAGPDTPAH